MQLFCQDVEYRNVFFTQFCTPACKCKMKILGIDYEGINNSTLDFAVQSIQQTNMMVFELPGTTMAWILQCTGKGMSQQHLIPVACGPRKAHCLRYDYHQDGVGRKWIT